jgi:hypothetical protein
MKPDAEAHTSADSMRGDPDRGGHVSVIPVASVGSRPSPVHGGGSGVAASGVSSGSSGSFGGAARQGRRFWTRSR